MKPDWPSFRKAVVLGALITCLDGILLVSGFWPQDWTLLLFLATGPLLLVGFLLVGLLYVFLPRLPRSPALPANWDTLPLEAQLDFSEKRLGEEDRSVSLWLLRFLRRRGVFNQHNTQREVMGASVGQASEPGDSPDEPPIAAR
jgi:hypothetical protein